MEPSQDSPEHEEESSPPSYHNTVLVNQNESPRRLSWKDDGGLPGTIRRAFSIGSSTHELVNDMSDTEEEGHDDHEALRPIRRHHRHHRHRHKEEESWRMVGVCLLVVFFLVNVGILATRKIAAGEPALSGPGSVCSDSLSSLKSTSVKSGFANGAVAADHPLCSEMGVSVMRDLGGNAVDAAVTVALCLGVANPGSSGIGGGAFLLIHADPVDKRRSLPPFHDERTQRSPLSVSGKVTEVVDCREIAPAAAFTEMFSDKVDEASVLGGLAIGVPGELRGLELAHARHGKLPWSEVVRPAMELARKGVVVNPNFAHEIGLMVSKFKDEQGDYGLRSLLTKRDDWRSAFVEGDIFRNERLGETLEAVMKHGSDAVYKGDRAVSIAKEIQAAGGIVTKEDLEDYRATLRTPVVAHGILGFSIAGVGPPSSGGAAIIGAARFLAAFSTPYASSADSISVHRMVEACKHAFAIRMSLSDPAFNSVEVTNAVNDFVNGTYMEGLRKTTKDSDTLPLSQYGGEKWAKLKDSDGDKNASDAQEGDRRQLARRFGYLEDNGTSHFSVADNEGNAVAMTTSVNTYFGSKVVSASSGFVYSNTMDDFANPGRPNYFGLQPAPANYIKPGKKPLSSMSPTMVFRQALVKREQPSRLGDLELIVGASGGPKIITAVLQVFLNVVMLGMPLYEAISKPRVHDQLIYHGAAVSATENTVTRSGGHIIQVSQRTKDALSRRHHGLLDIDYAGTVQAIHVDLETKTLTAGSDIRKGGSPSGY